MTGILRSGEKVILRDLREEDYPEFSKLMDESEDFLAPWINAPSLEGFMRYIESSLAETGKTFLICEKETGSIAGVINLSNIIRGIFQNAFMGYYIGERFVGKGYMHEGIDLMLDYLFTEMKLHRVEANIQPGNINSIKLIERCNFRREGFSPHYLKINGEWKDHERWAMTEELWNELKSV